MNQEQPLQGVPALVLAAGLGTRLRPLTNHFPKPAVPMLGRPLLGHPLIHLYAAGCQQAHVNAFHAADRLQALTDAWVQRRLQTMRLVWSVEAPIVLGTGGAIRKLEDELCGPGSPFLLLNGDSILGLDLPALWNAHQRHRAEGAKATLFCLPRPDADNYGAVRVGPDGRVLDLAGLAAAPSASEEELAAATPTIFCGVHVIEPEIVSMLPPRGEVSCIVRQGYAPLIAAGADIRAVLADEDMLFHDVGTPARYLDAQADLLTAADRCLLPVAPGIDAREALFQEATYAIDSDGREYGNPDAVAGLAGARLEAPVFFGPANELGAGCTIGPGASIGALNQIGAGARIEDCALWSGVQVTDGESLYGTIAAELGGEQLRVLGREN
ncbi:MAG TPA: hypothetical protein DIU15_12245 [Deltaproteobacteria bacterium]|nr:hypothetical protein [Deltaproteobacteria bacterium]HCP46807.1 hypothetical protein [Deltaproteobacteria bacterium]